MSIGELAMLVNDNFDKPLNQQIRDMQYIGSYLFTKSTTFTPDKSGYYKVIVVGAGGKSYVGSSSNLRRGGSGGVAISTLFLDSNSEYEISVNSTGDASFENIKSTHGEKATSSGNGNGGSASGGDFNYKGIDGTTPSGDPFVGVDVGVFIPSLMQKEITHISEHYSDNTFILTAETGYGILGYGAGGGGEYAGNEPYAPSPKSACVLIIPLELTE